MSSITVHARILSYFLYTLYILFSILTVGLLPILSKYFPKFKYNFIYRPSTLNECTHIFVEEEQENEYDENEDIQSRLDSILNKGRNKKKMSYLIPIQDIKISDYKDKSIHYVNTEKEISFLLSDNRIRMLILNYQRFFFHPERDVFLQDNELVKEILKRREFENSYQTQIKFSGQIPQFKKNIPKKDSRKLLNNDNLKLQEIFKEQLNPLTNQIIYGPNTVSPPILSKFRIIFNHLTSPFSFYVLICTIIWCKIDYMIYAIILFFMSLFSIIGDILSDLRTRKNLIKMSMNKSETFKENETFEETYKESESLNENLKKSGSIENNLNESVQVTNSEYILTKDLILKEQPSLDIFPNDVILLKIGEVPADISLLNCTIILDESFLTGESVPIEKKPDEVIRAGTTIKEIIKIEGNLTLRENSRINFLDIDSNKIPLGKIINTSFSTTKGTLIRALMNVSSKPSSFIQGALRIIFIVFLFGLIASLSIFFILLIKDINLKKIFYYTIDLIITIITPALPATVYIGINMVVKKMKKKDIICNNINRVTAIAKLKKIIFDKTGTLTEEGLNLHEVWDVRKEFYSNKILSKNTESENNESENNQDIKNKENYKMSTKNINFNESENNNIENNQDIKNKENYKMSTKNINFNESESDFHSFDEINSKNNFFSFNEYDSHKNDSDNKKIENSVDIKIEKSLISENIPDYMKIGMSTCHTLRKINNDLQGDPLDLKMFNYTGSIIENNSIICDNIKYDIIKTLPFDSVRCRQSVVVSQFILQPTWSSDYISEYSFNLEPRSDTSLFMGKSNSKNLLFIKGSPESIFKILLPEEKIRFKEIYDDKTREYSLNGLRVIAMAFREIDQEEIENKSIEHSMNFLGFLVFANLLKKETKSVINALKESEYQLFMATGDNILTASSVAKECSLINHPVVIPYGHVDNLEWYPIDKKYNFDSFRKKLFYGTEEVDFVLAIEGKEFSQIFSKPEYSELQIFILEKCHVYARMTPKLKSLLVKLHSSIFVGDGANDVCALQSANVGLAITANQCTLNSSFITEKSDLTSLIDLISLGREALVLSNMTFKFALYTSFIQFLSFCLLTIRCVFLSEISTMHYDILIVIIFAYFMSQSGINIREKFDENEKNKMNDSFSININENYENEQFDEENEKNDSFSVNINENDENEKFDEENENDENMVIIEESLHPIQEKTLSESESVSKSNSEKNVIQLGKFNYNSYDLLSKPFLITFFGHILIDLFFILLITISCRTSKELFGYKAPISTIMFFLTCIQAITKGFIFSKNYFLAFYGYLKMFLILIFYYNNIFVEYYEFDILNFKEKVFFFLAIFGNFVFCCLWDFFTRRRFMKN